MNYISFSPEAFSTPGFSYGRSGSVNAGTYLQIDTVPSNTAGRIVPFQDSKLSYVFISCELPATFTLEIQKRVGNTFTTVYTVTVNNVRKYALELTDDYVPFVFGDEVCVKIGSGSCKNIVVGLLLRGI